MTQKDLYIASKPRYEILHGLRGVAALMVVFFHCFETYNGQIGTQIINHGYLAVDFFFMLSGFVIGYAYDNRWDRMSIWGFFKRRLVRLHPMVVAGTLVGVAFFFLSDCNMFAQVMKVEPWKFFLCLLMGLLMLPCGNELDIRGWGEFNSFNGPCWSLTFEYIGNILYALLLRRLPTAVLAVLCGGSLFFLLDLTLGFDVFGLFPDATRYSVIGGWSLTADQMYIGMTRLSYPLLCGLIMSRLLSKRMTADCPSGSPISLRGGFWWASLLLVVVFSVPAVGGDNTLTDGIYQALCIVLVFPLVMLIGAGSRTTDAKSAAWCDFLGRLSYPLYITHYPLMYMQMSWVERNAAAPLWIHIVLNVGVVIVSVFIAWALLKLYDEPVREWLQRKVLHKKADNAIR